MSLFYSALWLPALLLSLAGVARSAAPPLPKTPLPETPLFTSFGTAEGLPSNKLYALAQGKDGYLWIGTVDGLARYDGVSFRIWRHDSQDSQSLPSSNVQALHVDASDRLWLGSEGGGISLLEDPHGSRFRHYNRSTDSRIEAEDVWVINSDAAGGIWFGGFRTGLYRLDPESGDVRVFRNDPDAPDSLPDDTVLSLLPTADGHMWVGTVGGVCRVLDPGFECWRPPVDSPRGHFVWVLAEVAEGGLHVGTADALWRFWPERPDAPFDAVPGLPAASMVGLLDEGEGHLWIGQSVGLRSRQGDGWRAHPVQPGQRWSFPGQVVTVILKDHEDGLWFATDGGGLARLPPAWRDFSVFRHEPDRVGALPLGLAEARDGGLWLVSQSAEVERLDFVSGEVRTAFTIDNLHGTKLRSVLEAQDGTLWLGHSDGLILRDPAGRERRFGPSSDEPVPSGELDHLLQTDEGVWVGVVGAALQLRDASGALKLDLRGDGAGGLDSVETEQLARAADGALWWAGPGGLRRRPPAGGDFQEVPGAPAERVFGFVFADAETLWLHRMTGLERYRWDGERLERIEGIGAEAGLPEVESGGVLIDGEGDLWLTTARGLFRYRPPKGGEFAELRQFTERKGLPSSEFRSRQPPLLIAGGRIAALTLGGVVVFDPARLREQAKPSALRWHSVDVLRAGARIELGSGPIELDHDDRDLRFATRLLSFADPQTHSYRFRLDGIDPDWIVTGSVPERAYAQLPPGTYVLHASAAGSDGRWVPALVREVRVASPWWWTPWAWAGYALSAASLLLLAFVGYRRRLGAQYRLHMAEQAERLASEASEAKGRFLATLGHEVRTPMSGLLGMNALLLGSALSAEQRRQAEAVRRAGQMMLRLVDEALDLSRIEAGRLELLPQPVDLPQLLAEVVELERPLAERKGIGLRLSLASDAALKVEADPMRLQQILLNLLGNAIKFTAAGEVQLRVAAGACVAETDRREFSLEVADTGSGLTEAQLAGLFQPFSQAEGARTAQAHGGSGLGLLISRQLAEAMGGRLQARSTPGVGSVFSLSLALPVLGPAALESEATPELPNRRPALTALRVLLVEDHLDVADALAGLMSRWGCEVAHAPHALQALALVEQQRFDVAVLDIDLPGVNGFELARLLEGRVERRVALTARGDVEAEAQALAAGFDVFLRKPTEPDVLREALRPQG